MRRLQARMKEMWQEREIQDREWDRRDRERAAGVTFFPSIAMLQASKTFAGHEDEDAQAFVSATKTFLSAVGGSDEQRRGLITTKLEGSASQTAKCYILANPRATAAELLDELGKVYGSEENKSEKKKIMTQRAKSPEETITQYFEAKKGFLADAGITDTHKKNYYILLGLGIPVLDRFTTHLGDDTASLLTKVRKDEQVRQKVLRDAGVTDDPMQRAMEKGKSQ